MKERPIITAKEARRFLGKDAKDLDDYQVMAIINIFTELAKERLKKNSVKKSNNGLG